MAEDLAVVEPVEVGKISRMKFKSLVKKYDHWTLLMGLLTLISEPIWSEIFPVSGIIFQFATFITILSGISITSINSSRIDVKAVLGIVALGLSIIAMIFPDSSMLSQFLSVVKFMYFLLLSGSLLRSIFYSKVVGVNTVINAISGYILMGTSFAILSGLWNTFFPGTFNFVSDFKQDISNELYFTIVTMTTLGYGDFLPLTIAGKSWSILMAISGQFYSTVVLAIIVGKFIGSKSN